VALPLLAPQFEPIVLEVAVIPVEVPTKIELEPEQLPFVTFTVYVTPPVTGVVVAEVPPIGDQVYEYAPVPPEATTVAVPFASPQVAGVELIVKFKVVA
jgi:hypothetical protein